MDKALKCVDQIIEDMLDRKGLGDEWDMLDEEIQEEIRIEWAGIIRANLREV